MVFSGNCLAFFCLKCTKRDKKNQFYIILHHFFSVPGQKMGTPSPFYQKSLLPSPHLLLLFQCTFNLHLNAADGLLHIQSAHQKRKCNRLLTTFKRRALTLICWPSGHLWKRAQQSYHQKSTTCGAMPLYISFDLG
jgi:hypothetical protein